jgi:hypothetical protein
MNALAQLGNAYQKNALLQDAVETLGGAAIAAGGQAVFTDMSPEEIALSALLGGGAAMAARPFAAGIGGRVGKMLDEKYPGVLQDIPQEYAAMMPGSGAAVRMMQKEVRGQSDPVIKKGAEIAKNIHLAKYNQNIRGKGDVEGLLTLLGRYYGDNASQLAVALATPALFGGDKEEAE